MELSVLDQAAVPSGSTPSEALRNTIELARLTDRWGYHRYWVAEHHAGEALASAAPEVLIARLGVETKHMRVGSGGVMLPHYSPLKVAENFRMLHALYPERIDLGVGRGPGGGTLEISALRRERADGPVPDDFRDRLIELLGFLHHDFAPDHPFSPIKVASEMPGVPGVWLLGSSLGSAAAAAQLGLPYAFATFLSPQPTRAAIEKYRAEFRPSRYLSEPRTIIALGAICAETDSEAKVLSLSEYVFESRLSRGDHRPIPTMEEAHRELATGVSHSPGEASEWPGHFCGSPQTMYAQLSEMANDLKVDELMIVTVVHDHNARIRSYELLAQAFALRASE